MKKEIGRKHWAIAEGYIPGWSHGQAPQMTSHETICILNTTDHVANVELTVYFSDREPQGPYRLVVPARRTLHKRINELYAPAAVPRETDYACTIDSDVPIVVQHTRLDSRQAEMALISTIAFPDG